MTGFERTNYSNVMYGYNKVRRSNAREQIPTPMYTIDRTPFRPVTFSMLGLGLRLLIDLWHEIDSIHLIDSWQLLLDY